MLFTKYIAYLALPILAVATPMPLPGGGSPTSKPPATTITVTATATETITGGQCNTGPIQCCNSVQKADSSAVTGILGLLGVVIQDINALVGLTCDPISVIGLGSAGCSATPVCCENNTFNGLIAIGCVPIIINL
ncbi:fungal hydrophobin [Fomitiporia mediterranea MF3/22]|uniref:fungal hydrophobin n=1 Tax=Fomitiporia mediterranea (strain MF3/22) TaxID=694068 RepID=UPI0004408321|nr:fungal hydrophobin [Fomitiporia mediterranea MF3/22]EJD01673.1 fungal hydrophobin [Fomitiporia mediterranea MF3/22]